MWVGGGSPLHSGADVSPSSRGVDVRAAARARGGLDRNLGCRRVTGFGARVRLTEDG